MCPEEFRFHLYGIVRMLFFLFCTDKTYLIKGGRSCFQREFYGIFDPVQLCTAFVTVPGGRKQIIHCHQKKYRRQEQKCAYKNRLEFNAEHSAECQYVYNKHEG